jgi:hypothetical protein
MLICLAACRAAVVHTAQQSPPPPSPTQGLSNHIKQKVLLDYTNAQRCICRPDLLGSQVLGCHDC